MLKENGIKQSYFQSPPGFVWVDGFEYIRIILEIKENKKCIFWLRLGLLRYVMELLSEKYVISHGKKKEAKIQKIWIGSSVLTVWTKTLS